MDSIINFFHILTKYLNFICPSVTSNILKIIFAIMNCNLMDGGHYCNTCRSFCTCNEKLDNSKKVEKALTCEQCNDTITIKF